MADHSDITVPQGVRRVSAPFMRREAGNGAVFASGRDALDLVHRLSTQTMHDLAYGGVRETLFTNEKGRVLDAVLVYRTREGVLLLASEGRGPRIREWLEKYTIMEDCRYDDRGGDFVQLALYGEIPHLPGFDPQQSGMGAEVLLAGVPCVALRFSSVTGATMRILVPSTEADAVSAALAESYAPCEEDAFRLWRVTEGVPAVGYEIGEHANPLESGAGDAVSFTKGCYIGQEVIARLDSYDKVQRHPARLAFRGDASTIAHGAALDADGRDAGYVTTTAFDGAAWLGLGLLRGAFAGAGTDLRCGGLDVVVVA